MNNKKILKYKKIHITGASGSGTTTLGIELSKKYNIQHFDSDNFFWLPTTPIYEKIREVNERKAMLSDKVLSSDSFVLSGSNCGWGDDLIPHYDLVIFLSLPTDIRIKRLTEREISRFGKDHLHTQKYKTFIEWTKKYDDGDITIRSRAMHENWFNKLNCPVLRIDGNYSIEERIEIIENYENSK